MYYFPTSSRVKIAINGMEVDLAFRLDWKESTPRIPIYGYNDVEYTRTIRGRKLIQGFLVCNYIAPHYLSSVLEASEINKASKNRQEFDDVLAELPNNQTEAGRKARAEVLASFIFPDGNRGPVKEFKKNLIDQFTKGGDDINVPNILSPRLRPPGEYTVPFDMDVYYTEPEFANWKVRLEGVEITDVSQTISAAGADGSSDPLYETTEFIAKRRMIDKVGISNQ